MNTMPKNHAPLQEKSELLETWDPWVQGEHTDAAIEEDFYIFFHGATTEVEGKALAILDKHRPRVAEKIRNVLAEVPPIPEDL